MVLVSDDGLIHPVQGNQTALYSDYNYNYLLPFEKDFEPVEPAKFFRNNWQHSITISVVYLIVIYLGQSFMRHRAAFQLTTALICWNWLLAAFSLLGAVRVTEEILYTWPTHGLRATLCYNMSPYMPGAIWALLFAVSKVVELGDTAFIVLRKRPLIFLHWYHHVSVMIYTWHSGSELTAAGRWFIWMNFSVHTVMYSYYALRAMGWKLSKAISMFVTIIQISQMVFGCAIVVAVYRTKSRGEVCQQSYENLYLCSTIYFTYFLLFAKFFVDAYVIKRQPQTAAVKKTQ